MSLGQILNWNSEVHGAQNTSAPSASAQSVGVPSSSTQAPSSSTPSTSTPSTSTQAHPSSSVGAYDGVACSTLSEAVVSGLAAPVPANPASYVNNQILVVLPSQDTQDQAAANSDFEQVLQAVNMESVAASQAAAQNTQSNSASPENANVNASAGLASINRLSTTSNGDTIALLTLPENVSVEQALLASVNSGVVVFAQPNHLYRSETSDDVTQQQSNLLLSDSLQMEPQLPSPQEQNLLQQNGQTDSQQSGAKKSDDQQQLDQWQIDQNRAESSTKSNSEQPAPVNDPYLDQLWGLKAVNAFSAWERQMVNGSVTVAVFDTGARLTHQDLSNNLWVNDAWDATYVSQDRNTYIQGRPLMDSIAAGALQNKGDSNGHGTAVSGVIAAVANNGIGIAGVSGNAKVLPVRVSTGDSDYMSDAAVVVAVDYVISKKDELNIHVVNMSYGSTTENTAEENFMLNSQKNIEYRKILDLNNAGILVVASAGNDSGVQGKVNPETKQNYKHFPSDYPEVVGVTSVQENRNSFGDTTYITAYDSNHNPEASLAAPGVDIKTLSNLSDTAIYPYDDPSASYIANQAEIVNSPGSAKAKTSSVSSTPNQAIGRSGSSYASPMVAGIAALLYAADPSLTPAAARDILEQTALDIGDAGCDPYYGFGLVDAGAAVAMVQARAEYAASIHVAAVSLDRAALTLCVGHTDTLVPTILPADATDQSVAWTSSDTRIASVDSSGNVAGLGVGNATISVVTNDGGKIATAEVAVSAPTVSVGFK
ncbi:MAG: S8 family serine peptidase, partial [Coriobacteriales bacterium]|nr:S8 family serine peptidase [Coriobacteriales bacterium]